MMWNISYYISPLIITFLYRRGYFVAESIARFTKITTGIGIFVVISLFMRSIGRSQSKVYVHFIKSLELAKAKPDSEEARNAICKYDFEFKYWPIDFEVSSIVRDNSKQKTQLKINRNKSFCLASLPCEVAAYVAIRTFGLCMMYPGSVKLIQSYLHPMLVQGRTKLIEEDHGQRFKIKSIDNNDVDTLFIDNRKNYTRGKTLVICSEGNAGFYEIGIMVTPIHLKYSVLGWNHPGFGGSTGTPYPTQDQNAIDAVMQFAIQILGFLPENIILFGWSIGGYSSIWAATKYPEVKGIILDATFDDVLNLALPRMPESLSGIVSIAIRKYINLHNSELLVKYNGPVLLIRRTEDEVIADDLDLPSNRGNHLLIKMLAYRYPNIFNQDQIEKIKNMLSSPLDKSLNTNDQQYESLLLAETKKHGKNFPLYIGANYSNQQKNKFAEYLLSKHMIDFKSSHCTPLPTDYFLMPWNGVTSGEDDFIFN